MITFVMVIKIPNLLGLSLKLIDYSDFIYNNQFTNFNISHHIYSCCRIDPLLYSAIKKKILMNELKAVKGVESSLFTIIE